MSTAISNPLSPGPHLFNVPTKDLTFEYLIHPPHNHPPSPTNLLVIQCPAWGIGSQYLQTGLSPLRSSPPPSGTKGYTLLFFHPRGTGNTTRPKTPSLMSTTPHLSSDLEDLRIHLNLPQFPVLVGHSNGGAIALAYAETYPDKVARLILLDHQLLGFQDRVSWEEESIRSDPRYSEAIRRSSMREHVRTDQEFTEGVNEMWPVYLYDPGRYLRRLVEDIGGDGVVMSLWCYRGVYGTDRELEEERPLRMVRGLEGVRAKTLVVFGREDMICGVGIGERTCEGIRDSKLLVYERCGHFPWIERGGSFFEDVGEFLGKMN